MQQPNGTAQALREFALSIVRDAPQGPMSRTAAATLSVLDRSGPQRITALAELEAVTQPAMTGLVQRLEASGLVSRHADPEDGRATQIAITPAGTTELLARRLTHDDAISARLARLSPTDRELLAAALPALTHLTEAHLVH